MKPSDHGFLDRDEKGGCSPDPDAAAPFDTPRAPSAPDARVTPRRDAHVRAHAARTNGPPGPMPGAASSAPAMAGSSAAGRSLATSHVCGARSRAPRSTPWPPYSGPRNFNISVRSDNGHCAKWPMAALATVTNSGCRPARHAGSIKNLRPGDVDLAEDPRPRRPHLACDARHARVSWRSRRSSSGCAPARASIAPPRP